MKPGDMIQWREVWDCGDGCCSDSSYKTAKVLSVDHYPEIGIELDYGYSSLDLDDPNVQDVEVVK